MSPYSFVLKLLAGRFVKAAITCVAVLGTVLLLVVGCQSATCEKPLKGDRCLLVTDTEGNPLPGVTFTVFTDKVYCGLLGIVNKSKNYQFTTGKDGMWRGLPSRTLTAGIVENSLGKEGYDYRWWLNFELNHAPFDQSTVKKPYVLRMRRILDEKSFLLDPLDFGEKLSSCKSDFGHSFKSDKDVKTVPVDLFYGVMETPGSGGGYEHTERYDDFLYTPSYDEETGEWTVTFSVTNAGCGIIATTNRIFVAPADGYTNRVTVSRDTLYHPAFTLYLKTRQPMLYAMLPLNLSGSRTVDGLAVGFRTALVNPYGGRELERDGRTGKFYNDLREEALRALLVERKYPPRPDIDARMENYKKRNELSTKMRELRTKDTHVRREIEMIKTSMKGEPKSKIDKAYEKQQKWIKETDGIFREYRKELIRLEKEAHTLNLPDESRKDKEYE